MWAITHCMFIQVLPVRVERKPFIILLFSLKSSLTFFFSSYLSLLFHPVSPSLCVCVPALEHTPSPLVESALVENKTHAVLSWAFTSTSHVFHGNNLYVLCCWNVMGSRLQYVCGFVCRINALHRENIIQSDTQRHKSTYVFVRLGLE